MLYIKLFIEREKIQVNLHRSVPLSVTLIMPVLVLLSMVRVGMQQCMI